MPGPITETGAVEPNGIDSMAELPAAHVIQHTDDLTAPAEVRGLVLPVRLLLTAATLAGLVALAIFGIAHLRSSAGPAAFQDLGAGISNATGLRGSLKTRWVGNAAQYQLEIKPIDLLESPGFSYVMANPPGPLMLHMKLMDATGYVVCGKDVLFSSNRSGPSASPSEANRDVLQAAVGDDGKVVSLSAQGILPCTAEQYKQVNYWDFSTNFPTVAEQDALRKHAAELKAREKAQERAAHDRQEAALSAAFNLEGDDQVAGYDASRNVLRSQLSRSFLVGGQGQQATAKLWASNGALFRYECDQHSHCVLNSGGKILSVTELQ